MAISQDKLDSKILKFLISDDDSTKRIGYFGLAMVDCGYAASTTYSYICCLGAPSDTKICRVASDLYQRWEDTGSLDPNAPRGEYGAQENPCSSRSEDSDSEDSEDSDELPSSYPVVQDPIMEAIRHMAKMTLEIHERYPSSISDIQWDAFTAYLKRWFDHRSMLTDSETLEISVLLVLLQEDRYQTLKNLLK